MGSLSHDRYAPFGKIGLLGRYFYAVGSNGSKEELQYAYFRFTQRSISILILPLRVLLHGHRRFFVTVKHVYRKRVVPRIGQSENKFDLDVLDSKLPSSRAYL